MATTPLIAFLSKRKEEQQRIRDEKREERRQRELTRRQSKEEERRKKRSLTLRDNQRNRESTRHPTPSTSETDPYLCSSPGELQFESDGAGSVENLTTYDQLRRNENRRGSNESDRESKQKPRESYQKSRYEEKRAAQRTGREIGKSKADKPKVVRKRFEEDKRKPGRSEDDKSNVENEPRYDLRSRFKVAAPMLRFPQTDKGRKDIYAKEDKVKASSSSHKTERDNKKLDSNANKKRFSKETGNNNDDPQRSESKSDPKSYKRKLFL